MFYKIFYTDKFIPDNSAGCARAMFVFIRPKYQNDVGLLQHELVHVRQFYRLPILHGILYLLNKSYRLRCEIEAYREQMKYYALDQSELFSKYISRDYGLDITVEQARGLLAD